MSDVIITNTRPEHAEQLEAHQRLCFPTLAEEELMKAEHFLAQIKVFPEGQHVALAGDQVVGQSSTFRVSGAKAFSQHAFIELMGYGYFTNHEPNGEWLYGADMSVHPDYRGLKLSRRMYDARKVLVRQLGMRGIVTGGMIPGYVHYRDQLTSEEYIARVVAGTLSDPTLTPQLRAGFEVRGVLKDYLDAGELGNDSTLLVWEDGATAIR